MKWVVVDGCDCQGCQSARGDDSVSRETWERMSSHFAARAEFYASESRRIAMVASGKGAPTSDDLHEVELYRTSSLACHFRSHFRPMADKARKSIAKRVG